MPRQQIVEFWKAKGAPPQLAEGIADAVRRESGIRGTAAYDPTAVNPQSGATGLYQDLGSRKAALVATADWEDPATQNNFAYKEVTGGDPEATKHWDEIKAAPSREAASELWTKYFERSRPASSTATVSAGNWNVSPAALDAETRQGHDVRYMSPGEYLAMTPPIEEGSSQSAKFRRLMASLNSGDDVESVPTLDVKRRGDQFAIYDQDGRNRALAAQQAGVDLIPVSIRGLPKSDTPPQAVRDMRGEMHPFDFERVLSAFNPIGTAHAEQAQKSPAVAASAWEPSGAAQPLSGGEWASAGSAEPEWAYRRGEEARKIEPDWFGTGVRTDIGAATAVRLASAAAGPRRHGQLDQQPSGIPGSAPGDCATGRHRRDGAAASCRLGSTARPIPDLRGNGGRGRSSAGGRSADAGRRIPPGTGWRWSGAWSCRRGAVADNILRFILAGEIGADCQRCDAWCRRGACGRCRRASGALGCSARRP